VLSLWVWLLKSCRSILIRLMNLQNIEFVNHAWQQNQFWNIRWGLTEAKPILNSLSIGQVCYIPALSRLHTSCETISQYLRYGPWMSIYLKNLNECT
jgi:hypothetical protein